MTLDRSDPIKVAFNSAAYAIAAGLAALPLLIDGVDQDSYGLVALSVVLGGAIFVLANVLIVCVAIGLATGTPGREVFSDHMRQSGPIFAIMIFVAAQAVIFWRALAAARAAARARRSSRSRSTSARPCGTGSPRRPPRPTA